MKKESKSFTNPFSENFLPYWDAWKDFKKEEFNFEYKGVTSEQMAVKHLVDLSEGDEEKAIKILCQSVRRKWQGFWPLHETTNGNRNGKSDSKNRTEQPTPSNAEKFKREFVQRNAVGKQQGDSDYLKAI